MKTVTAYAADGSIMFEGTAASDKAARKLAADCKASGGCEVVRVTSRDGSFYEM